jgi:hypothetical protein
VVVIVAGGKPNEIEVTGSTAAADEVFVTGGKIGVGAFSENFEIKLVTQNRGFEFGCILCSVSKFSIYRFTRKR